MLGVEHVEAIDSVEKCLDLSTEQKIAQGVDKSQEADSCAP